MRYLPIRLACLLNLILALAAQAALPGDLNQDGTLNVADLMRIEAMIDGNASPDPMADFNFDGQVDALDAALLLDALKGFPLPELLARTRIGPAGGTFTHPESGFKLVIPAGALGTDHNLVLARGSTALTEAFGLSAPLLPAPLLLTGLPPIDQPEFSFALPGGTQAAAASLAFGTFTLPRNAEAPGWHFQLLNQPADGITASATTLIWKPRLLSPATNAAPPFRASAPPAAEPGTSSFYFLPVRNWLGGTFYESPHFRLQPLTSTTSEEELNRMETLLRDLEHAFNATVSLGFPANLRLDKWGDAANKIKVVIKKPATSSFYGLIGSDEGADDAWCNPPGLWTPPWLELNSGVTLSPSRREIVSHEYFHYLQYIFAFNTATLWLDEMSATWMEGHVSSKGVDYCPTTYKNPRAPINGLHRASSRFQVNHAGFHGYSLSAFAHYMSQRHDWKPSFWHTLFSDPAYAAGQGISPLRTAANAQNVLGLDYLYHQFLRNYLSDVSPFGTNGQRSIAIFNNTDQNETDWKRFPQNGFLSKINKTDEVSGSLEHDFEIQDMGAVTWLLTFPAPKTVIGSHAFARVEVDDFCTGLFSVLFKGPQAVGITQDTSVQHDEEKGKRVLNFSLKALADSDRPMSIGLVAVNANPYSGDAPEIRPLRMTLQVLGSIVLPPETTYFGMYGVRLLQASADLQVDGTAEGMLGAYVIESRWPGAEDGNHMVSSFRTISAQLGKPYPQTIRIRSTITTADFGPQTITIGQDDYPVHAVPSENAKIFVATYAEGASDFYTSAEHVVPLATLAAKEGWPLLLNPANPTDRVAFSIHPLYNASGIGGGIGENLTTVHVLFNPPPPAPAP